MDSHRLTFRKFLGTAFDEGAYATDDVIAFVMPLFEEVLSFHEAGQVGPFQKEEALFMTEGRLDIDESFAHPSKDNIGQVLALFAKNNSDRFTVVESLKLDTDVDQGLQSVTNLNVHLNINEPMPRPAYLPGYVCCEQLLGHHDAQTDIFCLGLVLGSVALSLDLYDTEDLKAFVDHRTNPVGYNGRIHPAISNLITEMTELDRGKRAQDLYDVIHRLKHYRDFDPEKQTDLSAITGWVSKPLTDKNQLVLNKLLNRLFDYSHRNRLLYYKPNMRFVNLTVSSVPMVLHYQSIRPELLFTWNGEISEKVRGLKEIILNKYLRFEDHLYLPSTLDKVRIESQRDVHEYGFSQLKLVITFLNWHNLRENQQERIQSPLLLIPVELKRNKKLKEDHYILKILGNEAEVNPVVSNYLRDLYGIKLPDYVDLDEMSLEEFYKLLRGQVNGANQGITLNYVDKPRIKLVHSVAKQAVGNYKKRLKRTGNSLESYKNIPYSYQPDLYKPLGLEIFRQRVEPRATFLEFLINEDIRISEHQLTANSNTKERQLYELSDGENNPFSWDFDLCNIVLGNFNYRKMSLVRDYNYIIDQQINHTVFEKLFSSLPKQHSEYKADVNALEEWNHVIMADPTQTNAILQSRTGESYIIQGPPGTGKSQTITNLIADFVARGKSVLFVCEKRAALDVVFHRLRQQGLDKLCCYIHDSQGDKREFIRNLKDVYEDFMKERVDLKAIKSKRNDLLSQMREQLKVIRHFHDTNSLENESAGLAVRKVLERLVELKDNIVPVEQREQAILPYYSDWIKYGDIVKLLNDQLAESGVEGSFAEHPFSKLKEAIFTGETPYRSLIQILDECKIQLEHIRQIVSGCKSVEASRQPLSSLRKQVEYAVMLEPLCEHSNLALIQREDSRAQDFEQSMHALDQAKQLVKDKEKLNEHWRSKFSLQDTVSALEIAGKHESSLFGFLNGGWRTLKRQLHSRYNFSNHAVRPSCNDVLANLKAEYDAQAFVQQKHKEIQRSFHISDVEGTYQNINQIRSMKDDSDVAFFLQSADGAALITVFSKLHQLLSALCTKLETCLHSFESKSLDVLQDELESVAMNADSFDELLPSLRAYGTLPDNLRETLRMLAINTHEMEAIIARKTLQSIYTEDKKFKNTDQAAIESAVQVLQAGYKQLLKLNADVILAEIRHRFVGHIELSSTAASQLNAEQKQFKKIYNEGRKILENEFGKSMRYKSIRELSGKESRLVLKDLKPIWLMSPLSVSDSLPLDQQYFDAIIFDEASQITLEEGIPSLYRAPQTIIVGDEKQMPPSNFFTAKAEDPDDFDSFNEEEDELLSNDADSLLVQGSRKLDSVMLGWHYRSRYETLISFSNHAFYQAGLLTIPDKTIHHSKRNPIEIVNSVDASKHSEALFDRSISYHYLSESVYEKRINAGEANYIAQLVKAILRKETPETVGIVAFSQEQQHAIEDALVALSSTDKEFEEQLEVAYNRTDEDQFVGLFVKNLENVQGDERDIIIMSVCYGFDSRKRMIMNFGPINKKGGEKRLNVIFSRAKKHMAIVSSIKHFNITNEYNEGASYFKRFLHYAELISEGNTTAARTILDGLVVNRKEKFTHNPDHVVVQQIRKALVQQGYVADLYIGQSDFRSSLAVKAHPADEEYTLSVLVDDDLHYRNPNLLEQYYQRPAILQEFGWRVVPVFTKDWMENPEKVLKLILKRVKEAPETITVPEEIAEVDAPVHIQSEVLNCETPAATVKADNQPAFERLEFTDPVSNKFWESAIDGTKLIVRFGRIGTRGQTQIKSFASPELVQKEREKMVKEKMNKGYKVV